MTQLQPLDKCWWLPKHPPVFCVLGRYGDLILLLPAFLEIYRRTKLKPIVIVSRDYASVLDGVSYVTPDVVKEGWWAGIPTARAMAQLKYGHVIVPQWWNDAETAGDIAEDMNASGVRVLQSHGHQWGVNMDANPDFGTSMWRRAGFSRKEMLSLPLVFDRRSSEREDMLIKMHVQTGRKLLLYNFTGISSPFGYVVEMTHLMADYRNSFQMLDLGSIKAKRIYDLLGLMELAVGIITIDTATLHMCPAVKTPSVMFCVDGWTSSVPRGNCVFHCHYSEFPKRASELKKVLNEWSCVDKTKAA